jgi:hypothetical protein
MVLHKVLTISGESRVFLITLGLQPYFHKEFDSCFFIGLIYNVVFSFFYLIPICSEGNIVDHISAKHMIGASNSMVTMQLIEGNNSLLQGLQCLPILQFPSFVAIVVPMI